MVDSTPACYLSVVILTKNEEGNIGRVINGIRSEVDSLGISFEIIVVDANSSDQTVSEAAASGAIVFQQLRPGYAGALREGLMRASGTHILTLDSDGSHPPSLLRDMWQAKDGADIIIGSRYLPGAAFKAHPLRVVLSRILCKTFRMILRLPVRDLSSGYRMYQRRILSPEAYCSQDFSILQEILILAVNQGYKISEIPFAYEPRGSGRSKVKLIQFGVSYLSTLFRMWRLRNSATAADYDHRAFDSIIPIQRYWQRSRFRIVEQFLNAQSEDVILDIGCGSSRIIQSLPQAVAMDLSLSKLRFLQKTNPMRVCASTFTLPFADEVFNKAIHSQVIEHIPFSNSIFSELNRVINLGGTLIIGTPDYGRWQWRVTEYFYGLLMPNAYADEHITHYTRFSLCELLASHGFRILAHDYVGQGELIIKAEKVQRLTS